MIGISGVSFPSASKMKASQASSASVTGEASALARTSISSLST
jgi:hypothetical protein